MKALSSQKRNLRRYAFVVSFLLTSGTHDGILILAFDSTLTHGTVRSKGRYTSEYKHVPSQCVVLAKCRPRSMASFSFTFSGVGLWLVDIPLLGKSARLCCGTSIVEQVVQIVVVEFVFSGLKG